jgi:guanylate kinase
VKNLIAISAPSGSGKTTLCRALQRRRPEIEFSVSCTTRPRRYNERDGYDYIFLTEDEFQRLVDQRELVEYETVHGYHYGTLKKTVEAAIAANRLLLLEVDVKGAMSIKRLYPEHTLTIFIMPPSVAELRERLRRRGTEPEDRIQKRLERLDMELGYKELFDFVVVNDNIDEATEKLMNIIKKETEGVTHGT